MWSFAPEPELKWLLRGALRWAGRRPGPGPAAEAAGSGAPSREHAEPQDPAGQERWVCLPLRLALCGGNRLPARGKVPAVEETLHLCPLVPGAAAAPRQSEAAARWPKPALGRAAEVSGACKGSERIKQGGDLCLCSPTSSAVSSQSSRDN